MRKTPGGETLSKRGLSRNSVFREIVLEVLSDGIGMLLRDICPLVEARAPGWCWGNWKKGVHRVLITLLDEGLLSHEVVQRGPRSFRYRLR